MRGFRSTRRGGAAWLVAALLAGALSACGGSDDADDEGGRGSPPPAPTSAPVVPPAAGPTAATVPEPVVVGEQAQGLRSPWGVAVLPDGGALVSSRDDGTILLIGPRAAEPVRVGSVPGVAHGGEGGLLGLALSPSFATDHLLYAYYTTAEDNRIARMTYVPGAPLGEPQVIVSGIPAGSNHNGGRIAFGPDGMLYAGTGEAGRTDLAQDPASLGGKILRMTPEGRPAPGNPIPDSPVWSLGHRNVQGLAWDSAGRLWAGEFGQSEWDELNLIRAGGNYGWPEVEGKGDDPAYVNPVAQWPTDLASPSGIAISGDVVYLAGLRGERLWRAPIEGDTVGTPKAFFEGKYGRLRTVLAPAPGELWVTTSNTDGRGDPRKGDDRVLRLVLN